MVNDTLSINALDRLRRQFTRALAIIPIFTSIGGLIAQGAVALGSDEPGDFLFGMIFLLIFMLLNGVALYLLHIGRNQTAANLILLLFLLTALSIQSVQIYLFVATLAILAGAILAQWWSYLLINILIFGKFFLILILIGIENDFAITDEGVRISIEFSALILFSVTLRYFISIAQTVAGTAQRSANLLRSTAEIEESIGRLFNLDKLYQHAIALIRDRFAYHQVQIYMLEENKHQIQCIATTNQHSRNRDDIVLGSLSIISYVIQRNAPINLAYTDHQTTIKGAMLPGSQSELALPIRIGDEIWGVLDIQSQYEHAFTDIEIQALEIVAAQLGSTIRNANLFAEQQQSAEENRQLFLESEINLREIERLNRQLTGQVWEAYLHEQQQYTGTVVDGKSNTQGSQWSTIMIEAGQHKQPVKAGESGHIVAVPVMVRGEVIGVIEIETDPDPHINRDDIITITQEVSNQLAINLDNARLFEEAQQATIQEQHLNLIASKYDSANTVDELLEITLAELSQTLGATHSKIRLSHRNGVENT